MISLRGVAKTYELPGGQPVPALRDIDLQVERGEFLVITGRSGAGQDDAAERDGRPEQAVGRRCRPRRRGAVEPLRRATVAAAEPLDGLRLPVPEPAAQRSRCWPTSCCRSPSAGRPSADGRARGIELLEMVGLADRCGSYPRQLSAGQQQRVVIARALVNRPRAAAGRRAQQRPGRGHRGGDHDALQPDPSGDRHHDRHGHACQGARHLRHAARADVGRGACAWTAEPAGRPHGSGTTWRLG